MHFSTQEEVTDALEEAHDELNEGDSDADAAALGAVAGNGGRTVAQAITLLTRAAIQLSESDTASAIVARESFSAGVEALDIGLANAVAQEVYQNIVNAA